MQPIYTAGRRVLRVRFLMLLSLGAAAGAAAWGWDLAQTYGLREADGGVLAPLWQRLAWGIGVASLGIGFAVAMKFYGARYVVEILADDTLGEFELVTMALFGRTTRRYPVAELVTTRRHAGRLRTPKMAVNAPWTTLSLRNGQKFIVDEQGTILDEAAFATLARR